MLNSKNEAKVGYDTVAHAFLEFPDAADPVNFAYFSVLYGLAAALSPNVVVEI